MEMGEVEEMIEEVEEITEVEEMIEEVILKDVDMIDSAYILNNVDKEGVELLMLIV